MLGGHAQDQPRIGIAGPGVLGTGTSLVIAPAHLLVSQGVPVAIAAVTLAEIGEAYVGFGAAASSGPAIWLEPAVAIFFGIAAVSAMIRHRIALPTGLAAHAVWELLHHNGAFGAQVPRWSIPRRVMLDVLAASFLLALYPG